MRKLTAVISAGVVLVSLSCQLFSSEGSGTSAPATAGAAVTATPAASPGPTRPLLAFAGKSGLWVANPDGSGLRQVTSIDLSQTDLRQALSPREDSLAVVVPSEKSVDLVQINIADGEKKTLGQLIDMTKVDLSNDPTGAAAFAYYAIVNYNSIAWQPGAGRYLAFMGDIKGPTSDLYVYDLSNGKITQLTDGPSQAILPSWSPDGRYILHFGVSWVPPFGGAIIGYNRLDGIWAVRMEDQKVITEPKTKGQRANLLGWADDTHYITFDSSENWDNVPACLNSGLRSVDVESGKSAPMMSWDFNSIAYLPTNHGIMFDSTADCAHSPGEGTFLLLPGQAQPTKLADETPYEYHWLPESNMIQAYPQALYSPDGKQRYDAPAPTYSFEPAISKQGYEAWELIRNQKGTVQVRQSGGDWKVIFQGLVDALMWDPIEGNTLFIAGQDGVLYAASSPDFAAKPLGKVGDISQSMWIP